MHGGHDGVGRRVDAADDCQHRRPQGVSAGHLLRRDRARERLLSCADHVPICCLVLKTLRRRKISGLGHTCSS